MPQQDDDNHDERAALQELLLRQQRFASIGALAGGVAHELNNLLGGILMAAQYAATALDRADARPILEKALADIESDTRHGSEIVADLLRFARRQRGERAAQPIAPIIEDAVGLAAKSAVDGDARVTFEPDGTLPAVIVDRVELRQAFADVLINALQVGGGPVRVHATADPSARQVSVCVADDADGVPTAVDSAFDRRSQANATVAETRLRLSFACAIVTDHGGALDVASSATGGTIVTVHLPLPPEI